MTSDIKLKRIKYFLEIYYNQSFDDKDLENLVYEFRYGEVEEITEELLQELKALEELDDWELVAPMLKTSDRSFKPHRAKRLVDRMLACLRDENWHPENHTPFF